MRLWRLDFSQEFSLKRNLRHICCSLSKPQVFSEVSIDFVEKAYVQDKVPSYTYLTQDKFYERVYWPGTHRDSMLRAISDIIA